MATISRLLKTIGLFCKRTLQKRLYSAQETNDFKEPTNRSHPIPHSSGTLPLRAFHVPRGGAWHTAPGLTPRDALALERVIALEDVTWGGYMQ